MAHPDNADGSFASFATPPTESVRRKVAGHQASARRWVWGLAGAGAGGLVVGGLTMVAVAGVKGVTDALASAAGGAMLFLMVAAMTTPIVTAYILRGQRLLQHAGARFDWRLQVAMVAVAPVLGACFGLFAFGLVGVGGPRAAGLFVGVGVGMLGGWLAGGWVARKTARPPADPRRPARHAPPPRYRRR